MAKSFNATIFVENDCSIDFSGFWPKRRSTADPIIEPTRGMRFISLDAFIKYPIVFLLKPASFNLCAPPISFPIFTLPGFFVEVLNVVLSSFFSTLVSVSPTGPPSSFFSTSFFLSKSNKLNVSASAIPPVALLVPSTAPPTRFPTIL